MNAAARVTAIAPGSLAVESSEDLEFESIDGFPISGWLLTPCSRPPTRAVVLGHGSAGSLIRRRTCP